MTPQMLVRISASNEASAVFKQVANDARASAAAIQQAGRQTQSVLDRINAATGVNGGARRNAEDIAAYGAALDNLRAKYNPLFGTITRYKSALADIKQAHAVGAISAVEMATAIQAERRSALDTIATIKSQSSALREAGEAARLSGAQIGELGHITRSIVGTMMAGGGAMRAFSQEGNRIVSVFSIGEGGVGGTLKAIGSLLVGWLPVLAPIGAVVGTIALGFAALTTKINETAKTHVSFMNVVQATVEVAAGSIGKFFKPAIDQLGKWFGQFVDWIWPTLMKADNLIVGSFVFAFDAIRDTWKLLPGALGDLVIQGANGVIGAVEGMINTIITKLDDFIGQVNDLIKKVPEQFRGGWQGLGTMSTVSFGRIANPFAGDAGKVGGMLGSDAKSAFGPDYEGAAVGAISAKAQQLALADATKKSGDAMKAANDNAKLLKGGLKDLGGVTDLVAKSQQNMVSSALGAFGNLSGALGKLFQDNKAFAVSTAILQGLQGVAYALGSSAPPWNFINAAAVGIEAAANVANILATTQNSTTMPSTGGGAGSAAASTAAAAVPSSTINLTVHGSGSIDVNDLADQLAKSIADGGNSNLIKVIKAA